ncbi:NERD domain-containing protein [Candidatus Dependentiae bacterium]|nr:NERD domain-containing protein [Candidatus Dependentiae bacterium]
MGKVLNKETSVSNKVNSLIKEDYFLKKYLIPLELVLFIILFGISFYEPAYFAICIILIVVLAGQMLKLKTNPAEIIKMSFAQKGENEVAKSLEVYLPQKDYIINDILIESCGNKAQIDHLVINENGLFVIETKNYIGEISGDAKDDKVKQTKINGTHKFVTNPVLQNRRHCDVLKQFLKNNNISVDEKNIISVIIMGEMKIVWNITNNDAFIGLIWQAADYIKKYESENKLTTETIQKIIKAVLP